MVIGMIAAALGYARTDPRIQDLNQLDFAVRVDQPGQLLTDFQTVEWKRNTRKITYRDYLQDAVFVAAIGHADDDWIERIATALKRPRFQLYLGRRANAPAGVLKMQLFAGAEPIAALSQLEWQAAPWFQRRHHQQATYSAQVYADKHLLSTGAVKLLRDQVQSFDQRDRRYGLRASRQTRVELANPRYQAAKTDHDVWAEL
jgi:CRISPR system Cascade subunit CasD